MTFQEFQASGKDCSDLGAALRDDTLAGAKGRLYCETLFIEDASAWDTTAPGYGKGRWHTLIGRAEPQSDSLEEIERHLYNFAVSEGYAAKDECILTVADVLAESEFAPCLDRPENGFLRSIHADTLVGEEADKAITAGLNFARTFDPHPSVRNAIGQGVVEHIRILYLG